MKTRWEKLKPRLSALNKLMAIQYRERLIASCIGDSHPDAKMFRTWTKKLYDGTRWQAIADFCTAVRNSASLQCRVFLRGWGLEVSHRVYLNPIVCAAQLYWQCNRPIGYRLAAQVAEVEVPLRRHWSLNNFRMGSRGHEAGQQFKPWGISTVPWQ
jgi:hypothetical protein